MAKLTIDDLYKFNQLIHKLDDLSGGDYESEYAAQLRAVRDQLFTEDAEPIEFE